MLKTIKGTILGENMFVPCLKLHNFSNSLQKPFSYPSSYDYRGFARKISTKSADQEATIELKRTLI